MVMVNHHVTNTSVAHMSDNIDPVIFAIADGWNVFTNMSFNVSIVYDLVTVQPPSVRPVDEIVTQ